MMVRLYAGSCWMCRIVRHYNTYKYYTLLPDLSDTTTYRGADVQDNWKRGDPEFDDVAQYPPIIPPPWEDSVEREMFEKKEMGEYVKQLPTAAQKIAAVNPYERDWSRAEQRWHRDWHRPLVKPRQAWRIPAIPKAYNALPFYRYITKTGAIIEGLPELYAGKNLDKELQDFEKLAAEKVRILLTDPAAPKTTWSEKDQLWGQVINEFYATAVSLFAQDYPHLQQATIDGSAPHEAFWIRSGFRKLYPPEPIKPDDTEKGKSSAPMPNPSEKEEETPRKPASQFHRPEQTYKDPKEPEAWIYYRMVGDSLLKRGELAFCYSERPCLQIRSELPLSQFLSMDDPACFADRPDQSWAYFPEVLGYSPTPDILSMAPGTKPGDQCPFGLLIARPVGEIHRSMTRWGAEAEELHECFQSSAIATCFASLVGQAHLLGFTQFNDLTYPLATQAFLTDGRTCQFFCYQLNTLSFMNEFDEESKPCNVMWKSEPLDLFQELAGGQKTLNSAVMKWWLKFVLNPPKENVQADLRPYLSKQPDSNGYQDSVQQFVHSNSYWPPNIRYYQDMPHWQKFRDWKDHRKIGTETVLRTRVPGYWKNPKQDVDRPIG